MKCPVCKSSKTNLFLERTHVPVHQNLLCSSKEAAKSIRWGNLSLRVCKECGFVFNQLFDADLLSYGDRYDNTQTCSPMFQNYIDDSINYLIHEQGITNKTIIEVGCGNGSFLKALCKSGENFGIGFDPSYSGPDVLMNGQVKFNRNYYNAGDASISADVIICRHVIEHIPNPVVFLNSIRQTLKNSQNASIFFETPCLEWILTNNIFWDFFYEHCSYFMVHSLSRAFEIAGFDVVNINRVFNGQYLWAEAKPSTKIIRKNKKIQEGIYLLAENYRKKEYNLIQDWREHLKELSSLEKIALWGAGAKGVTFLNLVDPNNELIDCVVDLNPNKQEKFIPGTAHSIISFKELPKRGIYKAIVMNPNYNEENRSLLEKAGIKVTFIDLEEKINENNN
ncbi:class I SAM-dependent methyltransferase [Chlamydiota bacterium]